MAMDGSATGACAMVRGCVGDVIIYVGTWHVSAWVHGGRWGGSYSSGSMVAIAICVASPWYGSMLSIPVSMAIHGYCNGEHGEGRAKIITCCPKSGTCLYDINVTCTRGLSKKIEL